MYHNLVHFLQVIGRNEFFEMINFAGDNTQRDHHREPGEDSPGHEIGRKYSRMPARYNADRKVGADNRVNGKHQRRGYTGQKQIGQFIVTPLPVAAARLEVKGQTLEKHVSEKVTVISFELTLKMGAADIRATLLDKSGQEISGAYYVYVRRRTQG